MSLGLPPGKHLARARRDYTEFERDVKSSTSYALRGECSVALARYGRARGFLGRFRAEAEGAGRPHRKRLERALKRAAAAERATAQCFTAGVGLGATSAAAPTGTSAGTSAGDFWLSVFASVVGSAVVLAAAKAIR